MRTWCTSERPVQAKYPGEFLDPLPSEPVGAQKRPDYSRFNQKELETLKGFYIPVNVSTPHEDMVYVRKTSPGKIPWRVF